MMHWVEWKHEEQYHYEETAIMPLWAMPLRGDCHYEPCRYAIMSHVIMRRLPLCHNEPYHYEETAIMPLWAMSVWGDCHYAIMSHAVTRRLPLWAMPLWGDCHYAIMSHISMKRLPLCHYKLCYYEEAWYSEWSTPSLTIFRPFLSIIVEIK